MHSNHTTTSVVTEWKVEAHLTAIQYVSVERTSTVPTQTSCKVITGDVKHIYRQPGLHFVCDSVCVCLCKSECVCQCPMMTGGMPYVPHATGLITMAQTVVNKISISGKVQWFFLTNCFTLGGFNGSSPRSGCSGWLCTLFQFEEMRAQWREDNIQYTSQKERGQHLLYFPVCTCFVSVHECVCTWAPAGCGVSLSLAANVS